MISGNTQPRGRLPCVDIAHRFGLRSTDTQKTVLIVIGYVSKPYHLGATVCEHNSFYAPGTAYVVRSEGARLEALWLLVRRVIGIQ